MSGPICVIELDTPLGPMTAAADDDALRELQYGARAIEGERRYNSVLEQLESELAAYFAGDLTEFHTPIELIGTPFRRRVWDELLKIPVGETCSYADIARAVGDPKATRAVGAANGANPISILVPCHRVVRTGGALGGYGGGLDNKRWLLDHERRLIGATLFA